MRFAFDGWCEQAEKEYEPFPWERFHIQLYAKESRATLTSESDIKAALAASGYRLTLEKIPQNGDSHAD